MSMDANPLSLLSAELTDGGGTLGLSLPPGSLVTETESGPWHEPLLWVADGIAGPAAWGQYAAACAGKGLQPVLLDGDADIAGWWNTELDPGMMSAPGDHDAEGVLKEFWHAAVADTEEDDEDDEDDEGETIAPYTGDWPGPAPRRHVAADPDAIAAEVAAALVEHRLSSPRLALAPAVRSADLPAAIGWTGPVNHESDVARLCAVLRSWEDRFGVRVTALSHNRLDLSVAAPPQTVDEALAVAVEHFAFCPDNVWQGYETLRLYAEEALVGSRHWTFWWD
ncbi:DUF4253 domain-containing protein [Streptomyces sp. NPDC026659]|uniref:DUF4253 domain-containing protein n=1 Tax=Streptomyces sp. NPDC026659 TaxID=3155123 RepID=UPI0033EE720B